MEEFQKRRFFRRIILSRVVFVLLLVVAVLLAFPVVEIYKKSKEANLANKSVERQIEELKQRNVQMGASIDNLESLSGIEKELRDKFQIKKPGEEYVVILNEKEDKDVGGAVPQKGLLQKFLDFLRGRD